MISARRKLDYYRDRYAGCMLGGAVGDALGAPVEFDSHAQITKRFGPGGIQDFVESYGRLGAITDDTQMSLFTAEGLIRGQMRWIDRGICNVAEVIYRAYLRWLGTQGEKVPEPYGLGNVDGWLNRVPELQNRRAPGNTCLAALRSGEYGKPDSPINNSKGCGGLMRVAPVGLYFSCDRDHAFEIACEAAAITHGHPTGYLSAGFLAVLIGEIVEGTSLAMAIRSGRQLLEARERSAEVLEAIEHAEIRAAEGRPLIAVKQIEGLGQGWVAEEALAISLYCSLVSSGLEDALVLAVNHSGDSDSTGAITGNILGAAHGTRGIPSRWLEKVELRETIERLADDMATLVTAENFELISPAFYENYPPN